MLYHDLKHYPLKQKWKENGDFIEHILFGTCLTLAVLMLWGWL